jgi:hypothetical protein
VGVLVPTAFTVTGAAGVVATVSTAIALGSGLDLNTNGGDLTLGSSLLAVNALSGTNVDIDDGGTFQTDASLIGANVITNSHVNFGTGGGTDIITNSGAFIAVNLLSAAGPITGFDNSGDIIDDTALNFADYTGYSITTEAAGVQTVTVLTSDGSNLTFEIDDSSRPGGAALTAGAFLPGAGPLALTADDGGVKLTLCFLGGTMIATPEGEAAVETLQAGDLVLTADGRAVPVRWIGINTVATRFADPKRNMPICVTAGALGEGLPRQDLKLSPDHALLIDGVLVQAGALINGSTIHRVSSMPELFRYYHVEVAAHDLILAEGVPAETFVDNVSRMAFDNWQEFVDLCDGEPPTGEMTYPRAKSYRQVPLSVRARLAARAAA